LPVVDATPRGVCVRVLECVKHVGLRLEGELEPIIGAVVANAWGSETQSASADSVGNHRDSP
jgi:hypothetical protein